MTFVVPASKASKGQDKFEFTIGTQTFAVKKAKYLSIDEQVKIGDGDIEATIGVVFGAPGSKAARAVGGLDTEQFTALLEAYNKDSEVTPGESVASST